jgi:hypothetical protein
MLTLIHDSKSKKAAQDTLMCNLKKVLKLEGMKNIGFPGGNENLTVYSAGEGQLWVGFAEIKEKAFYWNPFGVYKPDRQQTITVEININIDEKDTKAGFFAKDGDGDIFLMHSGGVGGGRKGIGKIAFLVYSKAKLIDVIEKDGSTRSGIVVAKLNDPYLTDCIWTFVKNVQKFKEAAAAGSNDTLDFKEKKKRYEFEFKEKKKRYRKEFSGKKQGVLGGAYQYLTYHGDIVQNLYEDRTARSVPGEKVFNSPLIDLFVEKDDILSEVYEVKTGVGRQTLYTAIGQVVTHAVTEGERVKRFLVVPADEDIPKDIEKALTVLGIQVRRFRLRETNCNRVIELD